MFLDKFHFHQTNGSGEKKNVLKGKNFTIYWIGDHLGHLMSMPILKAHM